MSDDKLVALPKKEMYDIHANPCIVVDLVGGKDIRLVAYTTNPMLLSLLLAFLNKEIPNKIFHKEEEKRIVGVQGGLPPGLKI